MLEAVAESVRQVTTPQAIVAALGRRDDTSRAILLVGGAAFTETERLEALRRLFATLAGYLERTGTAVVDGGTDSGVMRLMADARTAIGGSFRLVGVAPIGAFERTTRAGDPIRVAPDHSVVFLVPGSEFGDEMPWLFFAADHLAGGAAPTIVVNGGRLSREEARARLFAGHRVVTVAGSGRAADELAEDAALEDLRASGRLRVIPLDADEAALSAAIEGQPEDSEG